MRALMEETGRNRRKRFLWLGYLGWIIVISLAFILRTLGYSQISLFQLAVLIVAATLAHAACYYMVCTGLDRRFKFDPHFVFIPNWLFFAPMVAYGYYALGNARGLMQVGWFMGFFFCAGYVRFRGVILTACWYMTTYLGVLLVAHFQGNHVEWLRESIRSGIFLAVCIFFAFLLDIVAAQKEYLTDSLQTLREKDRVISLLNQKLTKFVTTPLVEELAKGENDSILNHQRRKITVFFSDIQDFSIITDAMEPEELAQLLNEYFAEMIRIVFQFGGTVDKLMGDGLVAFFGAPVGMEPSIGALRSVQMAVNMQQRLDFLNEQWKQRGCAHTIKVRMGINTGLAIVGSFGSDAWANYTAIGSQINIAARLQQMAEPGQILISHSTYALVAENIKAKRMGETFLKGSHYPIQAYQFEELLETERPTSIKWQAQGCSVCLQPGILDIPEKESFVQMLEKYLGKPTATS
jgi:class 3 adenylate cyclase